MILFVNACVRKESRTRRLAACLLEKLGGEVEEIKVGEIEFHSVSEGFLCVRDGLIGKKAYDSPLFTMARQFAEADEIVIAAPYWDLSFPAALKQYIEQINVVGITFKYSPEGVPLGLCKARKLYYVMTAGGNYAPEDFGYGYIKALAQGFYGIPEIELIKATGLDIDGADSEQILMEAIQKIRSC